jgi:ATP-dependent helicase/nuclease subunit B
MPLHTHYKDWSRPVLDAAAETLLAFASPDNLDLSSITCVVPTRNAARRLRETLAQSAAKTQRAVLPGPVVQPHFFLNPPPVADRPKIANLAEIFANWLHTLRHTPSATVQHLFPELPPPEQRRDPWLVSTARRLVKLRSELAENGHTIQTAAQIIGEQNEPERWQELATLETKYLNQLKDHDRTDPDSAKIMAAESPRLPENTDTLVILATPDPVPLAVKAWEKLARSHDVHVVVHAPESLKDCFDAWGRPLTAAWTQRTLEIPNAETNLIVCNTPNDQAQTVRRIIEKNTEKTNLFTLGTPSENTASIVQKELDRIGVDTFNPAGMPINQTALASFTTQFANFAKTRAFEDAAECLRHPDFLQFLRLDTAGSEPIDAEPVLRELANCAITHLPQTFDSLKTQAGKFPALNIACARLDELAQNSQGQCPANHLRDVLATVYAHRKLVRNTEDDTTFQTAAREIREALEWLATPLCTKLLETTASTFVVLEKLLENRSVYQEREPDAIDVLGWLELHWDDAPNLVATDINDGAVPESFSADLFLPENARKRLGLHDNDSRFVRDAYLLSAMVESRRNNGSIVLLTGKFNADNDPIKPSRLLFLCPDSELPKRARKLFTDMPDDTPAPSRSVCWKLETPNRRPPTRISVTALKRYLECPFRFFLENVMDMQEVDTRKSEMDAMDYGTFAHAALEPLVQNPDIISPEEIQQVVVNALDRVIELRYGKTLSAPLQIQRHTLEQRLRALAQHEAQIRSEGWRTVLAEEKVTLEISGITVSGKIDRIDRRGNDFRVLDYKTTDSEQIPEKQLFTTARDHTQEYARITDENGKERAWCDLQLPVYILMLRQLQPDAESVQAGYFNLPKAVSNTGLKIWNTATQAEIQSAENCLRGIVADISRGRFWPPTEKVKYDPFEKIIF